MAVGRNPFALLNLTMSGQQTPSTALAARPPAPAGNAIRRRAAATRDVDKPNSTRAAGHGGSSSTMMRLYTADDTPGLRVDPFVVMFLSIAFIFSVVGLHLLSKVVKWFSK